MSICKPSFINARTKSLREKFSRNRSYSELSFKEGNTSSSLVSTPTESCSGSLNSAASFQSSFVVSGALKRQQRSIHGHPVERGAGRVKNSSNESAMIYSADPYCSAFDLSAHMQDEPRFPWQRDVAIQCDLLTAPAATMPLNVASMTQRFKESQGAKKKTSTSSTSSATSTLISAAQATLRMTGFTQAGHAQQQQQQQQQSSNDSNRFWKSSLLLPSFNVSSLSCEGLQRAGRSVKESASASRLTLAGLKPGRSVHRWPCPASMRKPALKRAVSFDSRGKYARLVQSTSSPSSPPEGENEVFVDSPSPRASTDSDCRLLPKHKHSLDDSCPSRTSRMWRASGLANRATALLGASAAMTAAAPFSMAKDSSKLSHNAQLHSTSSAQDSSMRKQLLVSRKQTNSAPDSFDDSESNLDPVPPDGKSGSNENEIYHYNTLNRLLNLSLDASETSKQNSIKSFHLELPGSCSPCHPNLPSPNIQSEIQEVNPVLRKLSVLSRSPHKALAGQLSDSNADRAKRGRRHYLDIEDDVFFDEEDETLSEEPPAAALQRRCRRRALVPPKLITDGYESATELDAPGSTSPRTVESGKLLMDPLVFHSKSHTDLITASLNLKPQTIGASSLCSLMAFKSTGIKSQEAEDITSLCKTTPMPDVTIDWFEDSKTLSDAQEGVEKLVKPTQKISFTSSSTSSNSLGVNTNNNARQRRRSSVVVIPPMQICPGDLLVYSKVLSQRSNMMGTLSSALLTENETRKHKNTWSLLRLFDRSANRNKAAIDQILCGLEEVLTNLQPSNMFVDETLLKFRGVTWSEFMAQQEERRISNASTSLASCATSSLITSASLAAGATMGIGCSRFMHNARFSSLQSSVIDNHGGANADRQGPSHLSPVNVRKKISLPVTSGSPRLERARTTYANARLERVQVEVCNIESSQGSSERAKPVLKRADSCSTVSDVESIADHAMDQLACPKETISRSHSQLVEEMGGDLYDVADHSWASNRASPSCGASHISRKEQHRREALWELFQSDLYFLTDHLMVLKNVFMEPLKKIQVEGYAMFAEPEVLFGNLDELCLVIYAFCREFLNLLTAQLGTGELQITQVLVKLFQKSGRAAAVTQAYHRYTLNYINALTYLETLRRQLEFTEFEKWCNRDTRCKKLQLTDLLVAPVQHVMRVPLLLKEIESRTMDAVERAKIATIIEEQEHSLRELDDKMRWLKNFERLLEIQRNIQWPSVLDLDPKTFVPEFLKSLLSKQPCERLIVSPRRQIVLEGPLYVLDSGKCIEMYVFLFDDLLLITRRKKGLGKKQSTLTERWVSNCSGRNSSFSSVVSSGPVPSGGSNSVSSSISTTTGSVASAVINAAASATTASGGASSSGEPNIGPISGCGPASGSASNPASSSLFKYVVYKQPLSLDRFYIHDVLSANDAAANLRHSFVLVCLNRFQQVVTLHTFQAASESAKNIWLSKLRDTCDRWKRTLQSSVFRNTQSGAPGVTTTATVHKHHDTPGRTSSSHHHGHAKHRETKLDHRLSSSASATSMASDLRENVSCSIALDDSILTTSTFT